MPNVPSEISGKVQLNLNIRRELVERFRVAAALEHRRQNAQFEVILEDWLHSRGYLQEPIRQPVYVTLRPRKR